MRQLETIFWLGTKELRSFFRDFVLLGLVIYAFTVAVISQAESNTQELHNGSLAYVDYDQSVLSHRLIAAFLPPYFSKPQPIAEEEIDAVMDSARYTFAIVIPPHFQRDAVALKAPRIQVNIDATAMVHAGLGSGYIQDIITTEVSNFLSRNEGNLLSRGQDIPVSPVTLATRIAFNPNVMSSWFMSIMGLINNITMLAIILAGAAVVREREHGTMDHLLVMPISPFEIVMAKIWANSLVITIVVGLSLTFVVQGLLRVPIVGSVPLFMAGVMLYLFFATSIGIFLATIARTMPQLGLLYILVSVPLMLLSGSNTPLESMPWLLQKVMSVSPSTYFVSFAQSILYRGAGFDVVWREFLAVGLIGALFLLLALFRFRSIAAQAN